MKGNTICKQEVLFLLPTWDQGLDISLHTFTADFDSEKLNQIIWGARFRSHDLVCPSRNVEESLMKARFYRTISSVNHRIKDLVQIEILVQLLPKEIIT